MRRDLQLRPFAAGVARLIRAINLDPAVGSLRWAAESVEHKGMSANSPDVFGLPPGEQPAVEELSATADTFTGRVQVEWDGQAPVTPLGQLACSSNT
jgi:hypothetical protein